MLRRDRRSTRDRGSPHRSPGTGTAPPPCREASAWRPAGPSRVGVRLRLVAVDHEVGAVALPPRVEVRGVGTRPPEEVVERAVLHHHDDDGVERCDGRGGVEDARRRETRRRTRAHGRGERAATAERGGAGDQTRAQQELASSQRSRSRPCRVVAPCHRIQRYAVRAHDPAVYGSRRGRHDGTDRAGRGGVARRRRAPGRARPRGAGPRHLPWA